MSTRKPADRASLTEGEKRLNYILRTARDVRTARCRGLEGTSSGTAPTASTARSVYMTEDELAMMRGMLIGCKWDDLPEEVKEHAILGLINNNIDDNAHPLDVIRKFHLTYNNVRNIKQLNKDEERQTRSKTIGKINEIFFCTMEKMLHDDEVRLSSYDISEASLQRIQRNAIATIVDFKDKKYLIDAFILGYRAACFYGPKDGHFKKIEYVQSSDTSTTIDNSPTQQDLRPLLRIERTFFRNYQEDLGRLHMSCRLFFDENTLPLTLPEIEMLTATIPYGGITIKVEDINMSYCTRLPVKRGYIIFRDDAVKGDSEECYTHDDMKVDDGDAYLIRDLGTTIQHDCDVRKWNPINITDAEYAFFPCQQLAFRGNGTDEWKLPELTHARYMFYNCGLFNPNVEKWAPNKLTNAVHMFANCTQFVGNGLDVWTAKELVDATYMFAWCFQLDTNLESWMPNKLKNAKDMFLECKELTLRDCKWHLKELECANYMFRECKSLSPLTVSQWMPVKLKYADSMFCNCILFTGTGLENWHLPDLIDSRSMFFNCANLSPTTIGHWNPRSLECASQMFEGCSKFTGVGLQNWDIKVIRYSFRMFYDCTSFNANLSSWNVDGLFDANFMFFNCTVFTGEGLKNWNLSELYDARGMFMRCIKLDLDNLRGMNLNTAPYSKIGGIFSGVPLKGKLSALCSIRLSWDAATELTGLLNNHPRGPSAASLHIFGKKLDNSEESEVIMCALRNWCNKKFNRMDSASSEGLLVDDSSDQSDGDGEHANKPVAGTGHISPIARPWR